MPTSLKGLRPAATSEGPARRVPNAGMPSEDRNNSGHEQVGRPLTRSQRFLGNAPIRVKVVLITLVPLMAMFLFAGVLTYIVTDEAQSAQQIQQLARLGSESSKLVNDLQLERQAAAEYAANPGKDKNHPQLRRFIQRGTQTEATLREFLAEANRLDADTKAPIQNDLQSVTRGSQTLVNGRTNLMDGARDQGVSVNAAASKYEGLINDLLHLSDSLARSADDRNLSDQLRAVASYAHYKESVGNEQIVVLSVLVDGQKRFTNDTLRSDLRAVADQESFLEQFRNTATPDQLTIRNETVSQEQQYRTLSNRVGKTSIGQQVNVTDTAWISTSNQADVVLRGVEEKLNGSAVQSAADFRDDAIRKTIIVITVALAALVVALLVSLAVARSMVRPLVRLRSSALEVAYQSLPEVVRKLQDADQQTAAQAAVETRARTLDIRSGDEIGQVAQAFNAVHLEAVRVASEQAQLRQSVSTMFVNLSRRSQLLVDRLIRLIDGLEQGERDPDRLSELFKLDHLATRMRRNDENLLVLAGADAGRRWTRPAPLVDVLRAATAEVEQYTRVKLGSIDDTVEISAAAVNDLVHLVAEILENATSFSSPRTDVVVDSRRVGDHVVIEIEDQGIGMSREQLAEFNERLAKPPVFDIAVSRMMGLFVVGRLASRHGVKVMLRDASGGGVLAIVTLPAGILHGDQPIVSALPPASAEAEDADGRPVERVASERIDQPSWGEGQPGQPALPAANAPYAPTGSFGAPAPGQPPFGGAPTAPIPNLPAAPPFGQPAPQPFAPAASAENTEQPGDQWRPLNALPFGGVRQNTGEHEVQRENTGGFQQPSARDLFGPVTPEPLPRRDERDDSGAFPFAHTTPTPAQPPFTAPGGNGGSEQPDPSWSEPTRPVPIIRDPAAAAATGTHSILGDLRPEPAPAEAREPDLTWGNTGNITGSLSPRPQDEQRLSPRPQDEQRLSPRPQEEQQGPGRPSPLPVRDPFGTREQIPQQQARPEQPAAQTPPAPAPAPAPQAPAPQAPAAEVPQQPQNGSRGGSAADAMAALRREASAERSSTTGAQKIFRAGPSDPPNSDPTIEMPLPIFDAIESEWFRTRTTAAPQRNGSNGSWSPPRVPEAPGAARRADDSEAEAPDDDASRLTGGSLADAPVSPAVGGDTAFPQSATAAWSRPRPVGSNGSNGSTPDEPDASEAPDLGQGEPVGVGASRQPATAAWESPADAGWRAAQAAAESAPSSTTKSGLPKRVPMAHFVPGRVETAAKKPSRPASHRSPEAVRGVLSSYRSGLEQGRNAGRPSRTGTTLAGSPETQEEM
ncbi:sensor histidine kinase [Cryptosporangium phraense]|uniref:histidine kinase n=1 Tax=Cryptosporangium phraense TaxID=2593070 RepID=A0A545AR34_9ACTN|nr:sensor histidine kinase [Cryptosporangium phraense]TQS43772.1 HAMP domain-containing protein [Cryptosporangium phraense]